MAVRMWIENPGRPKGKKKTMAAKRRRAKRGGKRKHKKSTKHAHARTKHAHTKHAKRSSHRRSPLKGRKHSHWGRVKSHKRRTNPDLFGAVKSVAVVVGSAVAGAIVYQMGETRFLQSQSPGVQKGIRVATAVAAAAFMPWHAVGIGAAAGLLFVPAMQLAAPLLAGTAAGTSGLGILYSGGDLGLLPGISGLYGPGQLGAASRDQADDALLARYGLFDA